MTTTITGSGISLGGAGVNPSDSVTKSQLDLASVPVGTVIAFAVATPPAGFLKCNGASLSRTTYNTLFSVIGVAFGNVDSLTFNLPDLRGEFIRGWDDSRGADAGRVFGTWQNWATAQQSGTAQFGKPGDFGSVFNPSGVFGSYNDVQPNRHQGTGGAGGALTLTINVGTLGVNETRPRNVALLYCIKYQ